MHTQKEHFLWMSGNTVVWVSQLQVWGVHVFVTSFQMILSSVDYTLHVYTESIQEKSSAVLGYGKGIDFTGNHISVGPKTWWNKTEKLPVLLC